MNFHHVPGDLKIVEALVKYGATIDIKNGEGRTPLHFAVHDGKFFCKSYSQKKKKKRWIQFNSFNFHYCLDKEDIFKYLINAGADVNVKDNDGLTSLVYAIIDGRQDFVRFLIHNKADINAKSDTGMTPLHYGVSSDQIEIVQLLIDENAEINEKTNFGSTPLNYAIKFGKLNILTNEEMHRSVAPFGDFVSSMW